MQLLQYEQYWIKVLLQEGKRGKESAYNVTGDVICNKLFITKTSNQEHERETFIADSGL